MNQAPNQDHSRQTARTTPDPVNRTMLAVVLETAAEVFAATNVRFNSKVPGLKIIKTITPRVRMIASVIVLVLPCDGVSAGETILLEDGGVVSMEAEHFTDRVNGVTHAWESVSSADGISGSASNGQFVIASPIFSGPNLPFDTTLTPYLDYAFRIATADTYFLHGKVEAAFGSAGNDSYYAHIVEVSDGVGGAIADWYAIDLGHQGTGVFDGTVDWRANSFFEFVQQPASPGPTANWELVPGDYTLRIHMRQDGTVIDKLVLQSSSILPSGFGPPESVSVFLDTSNGDTNADGIVNIDDLNNVRNHFGETGNADGTLPGDAVPWDGMVNIDDLNGVRNNFGAGPAAVPEPSALALASLLALIALVARPRRHA